MNMILLAAACFLPTFSAPVAAKVREGKVIEIAPSDDVWVYPHASDPARDEAMRIWGVGGIAVAESPGGADDFSYGFLRFSLESLPQGAKVVGATLTLTNVPNPEWTEGMSKATPLEVRPLRGIFSEKTWVTTNVLRTFPDPKIIYGKGPLPFRSDDQPTRGEIALKGKEWEEALRSGGALYLALTSTVDAAEVANLQGVHQRGH